MARRKSPRQGSKDKQASGSSDADANAVENIEVVGDAVESVDATPSDTAPDAPVEETIAEAAPVEGEVTHETVQQEDTPTGEVASNDALVEDDALVETPEPDDAPADDADSLADEVVESDAAPDTDAVEETTGEIIDEPSEPEPENTVQREPAPVQPEPESRSILPMILAGILTAILGFMAARSDMLPGGPSTPEPDPALAEAIAETNDRLAALEATVAALPEPQAPVAPAPAPAEVDLGPVTDQMTALAAQLDALTAQVDELAARPAGGDIVVPDEALNAALAELRDVATRQQAEIDALLDDARMIRSDATAQANATLMRAAMAQILAAIETGAPYAAAISDLEQAGATDIPATLQTPAAEGVTPLATLQDTIADAARDALAAARGTDATSTGLGGFLQRQLGTRSVEPREGTDPDAVLSRIEATVRAGQIGNALTEAELLPDPALDAMGSWLEQAQTRHDAVTAANALAERLSAL